MGTSSFARCLSDGGCGLQSSGGASGMASAAASTVAHPSIRANEMVLPDPPKMIQQGRCAEDNRHQQDHNCKDQLVQIAGIHCFILELPRAERALPPNVPNRVEHLGGHAVQRQGMMLTKSSVPWVRHGPSFPETVAYFQKEGTLITIAAGERRPHRHFRLDFLNLYTCVHGNGWTLPL